MSELPLLVRAHVAVRACSCSPTERAIFLALAFRADAGAVVAVPLAYIAADTGFDARTVGRAMRRLEASGAAVPVGARPGRAGAWQLVPAALPAREDP